MERNDAPKSVFTSFFFVVNSGKRKHRYIPEIEWIFPFMGFENCVDILNADVGPVGFLGSGGWGRMEVMSYQAYCCVSFPPLHQKNLLRRELALMHLRPL